MIIIKTKTGVNFVNEHAIVNVQHDKKHTTVEYWDVNKRWSLIEKVESITYTTKETEFKEDGTELEKLKKKYDESRHLMSSLRGEIVKLQSIINKIEAFHNDQFKNLLLKVRERLDMVRNEEEYQSLNDMKTIIELMQKDAITFHNKNS